MARKSQPDYGERIGLSAQKVYLDGDIGAIRDLAKALLGVVHQRVGGPQRGTKTIPDSEVNEFVCMMFDRCQNNDIPPPKDLVTLVRVQLRRDRPLATNRGYILRKQLVLTYRRENPGASLREIAKVASVTLEI